MKQDENIEYECVGHMAFGEENGILVALPEYTAETAVGVQSKIMEAARREGYKGDLFDRMIELGWVIRPIFARKK